MNATFLFSYVVIRAFDAHNRVRQDSNYIPPYKIPVAYTIPPLHTVKSICMPNNNESQCVLMFLYCILTGCDCGLCQRWLVLKDTCLAYVRPEDGLISDVILMDSQFRVDCGMKATGAKHGVLISNLNRFVSTTAWLHLMTRFIHIAIVFDLRA